MCRNWRTGQIVLCGAAALDALLGKAARERERKRGKISQGAEIAEEEIWKRIHAQNERQD